MKKVDGMKKTAAEKQHARADRDRALIYYFLYIKNYANGVVAYKLQKEKRWTLGRIMIAMLNCEWSLEKTCRACKDAGNKYRNIIKAYWNACQKNEGMEKYPSIYDLFTIMVKTGIADCTILKWCKDAGMKASFISSLCLKNGWSQGRVSMAFLKAGWKYVETSEGEISILDDDT